MSNVWLRVTSFVHVCVCVCVCMSAHARTHTRIRLPRIHTLNKKIVYYILKLFTTQIVKTTKTNVVASHNQGNDNETLEKQILFSNVIYG